MEILNNFQTISQLFLSKFFFIFDDVVAQLCFSLSSLLRFAENTLFSFIER
jgi:hypothetical protein